MTFSGMVYDGPMADTTVSVFAGKHLLAKAVTDQDGKYLVDASISVKHYEQIKTQPITYRAQRGDIFLYQYAGTSLEEALDNNNNQALITNFSTVEYVIADFDKNNFVTAQEWLDYQKLDRTSIETNIVRYGVGLKAVIDYSASLAGFDNSTVWLRALFNSAAWDQWYSMNHASYRDAWQTLYSDEWFLEQEKDRFTEADITVWKDQIDNVVVPENPVLKNVIVAGLPQRVSVGDKLSPTLYALWSDESSSDVTSLVEWSATPADAVVITDGYPQVMKTGPITLTATYQGATATIQLDADAAVLASLRLDATQRYPYLHDQFKEVAYGVHKNDYLVDYSEEAEWTSSNPEILESLGDGEFLAKKVGSVKVTATMGELTAEHEFNVTAKLLGISLNLPNNLISRGETLQLTLNGEFNDGTVAVINEAVTWSSSNSEVLEVAKNGEAKGIKEGEAVVTASYNDYILEEKVKVTHPKIVSSTPNFVDGVLTMTEGDVLEYKFKFVRSNGVEHVFTATSAYGTDEIQISDNALRENRDESGIQVAQVDTEKERIYAVRSGEDKLTINNVPDEFKNILFELGAIEYVSSADSVTLKVNVTDNQDVYQWNRFKGNSPVSGENNDETANVIQAIQSGDTLYRFWFVDGTEKDGIYITKLTDKGESAPEFVLAANKFVNEYDYTYTHKLINNGIIHDNYGYVLLITDNDNQVSEKQQIVYRYKLSDGTLTEVDISGFNRDIFRTNGHSFAFTQSGDLVVIDDRGSSSSHKLVTPYIYHFDTNTWEEKDQILGQHIQLPSDSSHMAVLNTNDMSREPYVTPVLSIMDLETLEVTSQEFVIPGDAEYVCRDIENMSIATGESVLDSGAGCMVVEKGDSNGVGYWLWDSIAELPKLHLFNEGEVEYTSNNYAVAARKPDGNMLFSSGRITIDSDTRGSWTDIAEIVDVEVDGIVEKQVKSQRYIVNNNYLDANIDTEIKEGNQYLIQNPNVPNETFAVSNRRTIVIDEHGQWQSDKFMYQLPEVIVGKFKLFNLGNAMVISPESDKDSSEYWLLQMRKPVEAEQPEEPEQPVVSEKPTEPALAE
ncbi:Ig-like domain-containing protein [uncultured Photobacterium sp.]|uniref:Ig-like domain-containing protein n=1 Tax=uncultured Photobacterium sp. TaxID=173973 RepID=UPI00262877E2|nr:Ig-like domain-containing protein [uncultured Photobacterium sp.]